LRSSAVERDVMPRISQIEVAVGVADAGRTPGDVTP
jgi:hypothetical protein